MENMSTGSSNSTNTPQESVRRVRVPLRIKITIPYLILSLILALAAAYLTTQLVIENIQERFDRQLYEAGKISSELLVGYESQLLETERLLANGGGISDAIRANDPNDLLSLALGIVVNDQQEAAEFFDMTGNQVLSMRHRAGGNLEDYDVSTGGRTSLSSLDLVQYVLTKKSDSQGNKFADLVITDAGDFLYVSGPVYDAQGNQTGVVLVGRSLSRLASDLRTKTFAQLTFYDPAGEVLYSTLPFPENLPAQTMATTTDLQDSNSPKRDLLVANIPFTEVIGVWNVRDNYQVGFLGVALSQNAVVQASTSSRWRIFLLVASAIFLVILVGINLANVITRPLVQLVKAAVKVSRGDLDVRVNTHTNDEFSILTESFNAMIHSLNQSHQELIQAHDSTLEGWAKALELRDSETQGHSERVTGLTVRLAEAMGIRGEALQNIRRGALLHDIGKMGIPDSILYKNGPLDEEEMRLVHLHPGFAYNMLKGIDYLQEALEIPYCHHEKWDGTGYPRGLRGEEIPISARIFAIVDVWDALVSDRPYRKAMPPDEVITYLKSRSESHFDPRVVEAFLRIMTPNGLEN